MAGGERDHTAEWKKYGFRWLLAISVLAALVVGVKYGDQKPSQSSRSSHLWDVQRARTECRNVIVAAAKWGDAERPPLAENGAGLDGFLFSWPRGSFHFRNGYGGKMPMSAVCNGSLSGGYIERVVLNGDVIYARDKQ